MFLQVAVIIVYIKPHRAFSLSDLSFSLLPYSAIMKEEREFICSPLEIKQSPVENQQIFSTEERMGN